MANQTQKKYDYQEVVTFTNSNGPMDQSLTKLQEDLKALRELVNRCEPLYHGAGQNSTIRLQYQGMYNNIGSESKGGFWGIVKAAVELQNLMHANAVQDRDRDQGM